MSLANMQNVAQGMYIKRRVVPNQYKNAPLAAWKITSDAYINVAKCCFTLQVHEVFMRSLKPLDIMKLSETLMEDRVTELIRPLSHVQTTSFFSSPLRCGAFRVLTMLATTSWTKPVVERRIATASWWVRPTRDLPLIISNSSPAWSRPSLKHKHKHL